MSIGRADNSKSRVITLPSLSWATYDFANTIFSMNVVSLYFALWVVDDLGGTDLMVAFSRSAAMLFILLTMPLLGALSDRMGNRKSFIFIFTILCCLSTALLGFEFDLITYLVIFGVAVFSFQAALVFYNALLPDVSPPNKRGKVSGLGVSLGYLGSIVGMLLVRPFVGVGDAFSRQEAFIPTALLFFLFSFPLFFFVRDKRTSTITFIPPLWKLFKAPYRVFRSSGGFPNVRRFLIGRFFIVDAMETIIAFMSIYLVMVGSFDQRKVVIAGMDEIMIFLMTATVFAVLGSLVWGMLTDRIGAGKALKICSLLWVITLLIAVINPVQPLFWLIGPLAGICLGGVWTTDRAYLLKMVPEGRRAEFFGLYAVSGRLAAVVGPLMWGLTVELAEPLGDIKYRFAVLTVFIMMLIGYLLIRKLPEGDEIG